MNDSSVLATPAYNSFYPVEVYLTVLQLIFFGPNLTKENDPIKPIPIVNALYEHLDRSSDELEAKMKLTHRMLEGKDLYGGNENETLDSEYINATFDHIISNAVFSKQYGSITGFLVDVVKSSDNLALSNLKIQIVDNLSKWEYQNTDCSVSNLSSLTVKRITETLIWPLFPQPEHDMNVTDVDYIYAQAGLAFVRSVSKNFTNFTFDDYIAISQNVESQGLSNVEYRPALSIFILPAMLHYAHVKREFFQEHKVKNLLTDKNFQADIFHTLFSYFENVDKKIQQIALESHPAYQYGKALSAFRNRTQIAREILLEKCPKDQLLDMELAIRNYKDSASNSECLAGDIDGGKEYIVELPNLDVVYDKEVNKVTDKYPAYMKILLEEEFEKANLSHVINASDTIISQAHIVMEKRLQGKKMTYPHPNATLFSISHQNKISLYAVINNHTHLYLVKDSDDHKLFLTKFGILDLPLCDPKATHFLVDAYFFATVIGRIIKHYVYDPCAETKLWEIDNPAEFKMDPKDTEYPLLKERNEGSDKFVDRLANLLAKNFKEQFKVQNYEPTFLEGIVNSLIEMLPSLIPFRDCYKELTASEWFGAIAPCAMDIVSLIPVIGTAAKIGSKFSTIGSKIIMASIGTSIRSFALKQSFRLALSVGFRESFVGLSNMVYKVFLTKQMFKEVLLTAVRTVDPGIELLGTIFYKGPAWLGKLSLRMLGNLRKISGKLVNRAKIGNFLESVGKLKDKAKSIGHKMEGYEVLRNIEPGHVHPSGPRYVRLSDGVAELRKTVDQTKEIAVVTSRTTKKGEVLFKQVNLKTGKIVGPELKYSKDGRLETFDPAAMHAASEENNLLMAHSEWKYESPESFFKTTRKEIPAFCRKF